MLYRTRQISTTVLATPNTTRFLGDSAKPTSRELTDIRITVGLLEKGYLVTALIHYLVILFWKIESMHPPPAQEYGDVVEQNHTQNTQKRAEKREQ